MAASQAPPPSLEPVIGPNLMPEMEDVSRAKETKPAINGLIELLTARTNEVFAAEPPVRTQHLSSPPAHSPLCTHTLARENERTSERASERAC